MGVLLNNAFCTREEGVVGLIMVAMMRNSDAVHATCDSIRT